MKYIFLHGLGQVPSDWETTIKRLDLGLTVLIYLIGFQEKKLAI